MKHLVAATVGALALGASTSAWASTTCQDTPQGQECIAQVDFQQFAQTAYETQYEPEWCWAASISMTFAFYGYDVSQPTIVSSVYGSPEDMPAQAGIQMAEELNRTWTDANGRTFVATLTGVYDAGAGVYALTNEQIISELDQGHPLVIGTNGHAVVVTAVEYFVTASGPDVVDVGVFDPWPTSGGARSLTAAEATPVNEGGELEFAATVRITPASSETSPPAGTTPGTTPGTTTPQPTPEPEQPTERPTTDPVSCACATPGSEGRGLAVVLLALLAALGTRARRLGRGR